MSNVLKKYNDKRDFNKTNEPVGKKKESKSKLRFVVQHHLARKDHYDFRLEWNGTLKSWAIPKGPSYNTEDKRLAIEVEDHPISYRDFEGTIPKGEYGGGTVMIWDEGYWEPESTLPKNFNVNMIKFVLKGKRLKGKWTLIHFKEENWLLIKEKDAFHEYDVISKFNKSVKTNRTMREIEQGKKKTVTSKEDAIIEDVTITNPNKVIFSRPKVTKLEIAMYYYKAAERMLPYLENRIISTIRAPEGVKGDTFFKKHLESKNKEIGRIFLKNESNKKEDYYYIKNSSGLISEVQMNSYEFHTWGSRIETLRSPDIMVFDLDPDEKLSIAKLREGVRDLKSILDELELKSFLKTSGGKGYHILVPLKQKMTWTKFRETAKNIALLMEGKWPEKYTSNMRKEKRKGKIFIDWARNTKGATSVAPYSIRLRKRCSVSMPISWNELDTIKPDAISIEDALKRLKRKDPWQDFFN